MSRWIKVLVLSLCLFVGYMYVIYTLTVDTGPHMWGYHPNEKLAIINTYVNSTSNTIIVDVKVDSSSNPIHLTFAILRNATGMEVAIDKTINLNLVENQSTTVRVNYNCTLPSGPHVVVLATEAGGSFVSPSFTVP